MIPEDGGIACTLRSSHDNLSFMSAARPTVRLPGEPSGPGRLRLLVLKGGVTATHALPDQGCVAIGRGEGVDIQIDDPSISRQHARLHLGVPLRLEDLGSANG